MSFCHYNHTGFGYATRISVLAVVFLVTLAGWSMAGEFERSFKFEGQVLELTSLVGEVQVIQARGDEFIVEVSVRGDDADESLIEFVSDEGRISSLVVDFPIDEHKKYVYPPMGRGSKTSIRFNEENPQDGSWLRKIFSSISGPNIKVSGSGRGLEMWADITIKVPRERSLVLANGVGKIFANDCTADLDLDIHSGAIEGNSIVGFFKADTGSGRVVAENITGDLHIDTGSGSVEVIGSEGDDVLIDTGSGSVVVDQVICRKLDIDTGSGGVKARHLKTDGARIDTGSGSVTLQLDRMGTGEFEVDTGSGSVQLILPDDASATIVADTGSGGVDVDLPGAEIKKKDRDRVKLVVGDGEANVVLDTGSGSIKISR